MGGRVTYKFVSTPGEKERFHVDPESGRITTADVSIHSCYSKFAIFRQSGSIFIDGIIVVFYHCYINFKSNFVYFSIK